MKFFILIFEIVNCTYSPYGCCEIYVIKQQYTNSTGDACTKDADYLCFYYGNSVWEPGTIGIDYDMYVCTLQDPHKPDGSCIPSPRTFKVPVMHTEYASTADVQYLKYLTKSNMWVIDQFDFYTEDVDPYIKWETSLSGLDIKSASKVFLSDAWF